jgi:hypothetical protein
VAVAVLKFNHKQHREAGEEGILDRIMLRGVRHPVGLLAGAGAEHAGDLLVTSVYW